MLCCVFFVFKKLKRVNFPNVVIGLFLDFCFPYPLVAHLEVSRRKPVNFWLETVLIFIPISIL